MPTPERTFVIGDIHGDSTALEALLARLPARTERDTLVLLGDYVDRGPDSRGVVARVQRLAAEEPGRVVALRGNHEDLWIESYAKPNLGFLLPQQNGAAAMYRSYTGGAPLGDNEELSAAEVARLVDVAAWFPRELLDWMAALPVWYEDAHAIYVHAGLDGEGTEWKHPREGREKPLMWMREPDFYAGYAGKRLVFGHTHVGELPLDHLGRIAKFFDDPGDVWTRGDLIGIDTGCGKGGFLSAIELPRMKVHESR